MKIITINENNVGIAVVQSSETLISDVRSALDFMATVHYETGCSRVIINKSAICEDFFDLKTRIAGKFCKSLLTII